MEALFARGLEIAGCLLALPYLILPLLLRAAASQPIRRALTAFDPSQLSPSLREFFHTSGQRLVACGFELEAQLVNLAQPPQVTTHIALYRHPGTSDHAIVVAMVASDTQPPKTAYVECATRLADGTIFNTANTPVLPSFSPVPGTTSWKLPSVRDPARLYEIHRALVTRFGRTSERKARDRDEPAIAYLQSSMARELDNQVALGNYVLDEANGRYAPTWRGAILMAWRALWPASAVRRALRNRRERDLLDIAAKP